MVSNRSALLVSMFVTTIGCHFPSGSIDNPVWVQRHIDARWWMPYRAEYRARAGYLRRAVQYYTGDIEVMQRAEPIFLGHLTFPTLDVGIVTRTGGTHFRVIDQQSSTTTNWVQIAPGSVRCQSYGGAYSTTTNCTATDPISLPVNRRSDWFLIEVSFVPPERLRKLPVHLQPTPDMFY